MDIILTNEQSIFIDKVLQGSNVLVDACVGSGKTTAIQCLCNKVPSNKKILYLTYNKLLKIDAREKIKGKNIIVTNYHGYAWSCLNRIGIKSGISDLLQVFNREKPPVGKFDLIVLDEYQDIDLEISQMLDYIVSENPTSQLVAVGDMKQKIYDKTSLDVQSYIEKYLGKFISLEFTNCFRLPKEYSQKLGRIWMKSINGVNNKCEIIIMPRNEIITFLSEQQPSDLLCLGAREGVMASVLNELERKYNDKFNKNTVYASISDKDTAGVVQPSKDTAIFTTYDSSKGLERKICVVFDFTESYWQVRVRQPQQKYEILRNIFLVAASRGKNKIIFVSNDEALLSEQSLSTPEETNNKLEDMTISEMFDFKYQEDIEECYGLLEKKKIEQSDKSIIDIRSNDGLIDLTPCIGIFQEAFYFDNYDIKREFELFKRIHRDKKIKDESSFKSLGKKIVYLTSLETNQRRYYTQVSLPLVSNVHKKELSRRLESKLKKDEQEQILCNISFAEKRNGTELFQAIGYADVLKDNVIYELKFVSELTHVHFLQCACYVVALGLKKGILWNTRNNDMYEIAIPNEKKFLDAVAKTITKRTINKYYKPRRE